MICIYHSHRHNGKIILFTDKTAQDMIILRLTKTCVTVPSAAQTGTADPGSKTAARDKK